MIVDNLNNAFHYYSIHSRFEKAFEYVNTFHFMSSEEGTIEVDGELIKLIVSTNKLKSKNESLLEAHRKFIDIHIPFSQPETFGWKSLHSVDKEHDEYDTEKDFELFNDTPSTYITVEPGEFVIFLPEDAHAPLIGTGDLKKIIFKIFID